MTRTTLALFTQYHNLFTKGLYYFSRTGIIKHKINTGESYLFPQPVCRIKIIDEIDKDLIRQSSSPWTLPIILVQKKDGTTQF